ncbi:hypothetical protein K461DRAFT_225527 [Myriangium duriaei CBS 260.36]|uniref:Vesicle-mediated transport protein Vid24 n=1 Tax=Myriangium duriaei CBS 260.36 TaxID=1168546 RepID=A0A9P4IZW0_9PEZI|nr:hypothetical protein K461DRAFT_225527 [Myriangium duriaei CBS 260.36]
MPSSPGQSDEAQTVAPPPAFFLNPHTTCPPEEDRTSHVTQDSIPSNDIATIVAQEQQQQQTSLAQPREADHESGTDSENEPASKRIGEIEEAIMRDSPSPVIPQEERSEHDARLAQSLSSATLSPRPSPEWPVTSGQQQRIFPNSTSSCLRPGSKFIGTQQSDRQVYNVQVELKYVDMEESFLCGYLRIQGLTDDHPTLTTYFEGEIIGNKHTFKTAHPEWGSSEKVDMQHWARFPAWRPLAKQAKSPAFTFKNFAQREHLFMRWKEYFLVPDHKVKTISGASFEGFYYICFNQCSGSVSGIYFHAKSEKYQQLELEHVNDKGCTGAMEFR